MGRKIAFFTHYSELYGANFSLLNLIEGLGNYGIEAHVLGPEPGDLFDTLDARGIPNAILPFEWWVSSKGSIAGTATRLLNNIRHLRPIAKQLQRWHTDLVYSNSSVFAIGAMTAARLRLPHIWHLREFGNLDYDLWPDFGARLTSRIFQTANATVCVSKALKKHFFLASDPKNSHVIYNGVASEAVFDERRAKAETFRHRTQRFTFVLIGRFRESKGQHVAIEAFASAAKRFPNVRLLLVGGAGGTGDQSYFDHCRALVTELKIRDRVEFWGYIPDPERAFLAADVALMCSKNEAMGRVTVEAMSCCRPVIGFDSGGTSELIDSEKSGLLYRGGANELADCLVQYALNPQLAMRHGEAGWSIARERHSIETYAAQIHEVIRSI